MSNYSLSVHRYRELKHFCLQYNEMRAKLVAALNDIYADANDPVSRNAVIIRDLLYAIDLIERTAIDTDCRNYDIILKSVTEDVSFKKLGVDMDKGAFDDLRAKFFYILSERKGV